MITRNAERETSTYIFINILEPINWFIINNVCIKFGQTVDRFIRIEDFILGTEQKKAKKENKSYHEHIIRHFRCDKYRALETLLCRFAVTTQKMLCSFLSICFLTPGQIDNLIHLQQAHILSSFFFGYRFRWQVSAIKNQDGFHLMRQQQLQVSDSVSYIPNTKKSKKQRKFMLTDQQDFPVPNPQRRRKRICATNSRCLLLPYSH